MTIPGIGFVIDSGFIRDKVLDLSLGLEILTTIPISKASADQRAGRSGREHPGKTYRLYTKDEYSKMNNYSTPEIRKTALMQFILLSKLIGVSKIQRVDMIKVIRIYFCLANFLNCFFYMQNVFYICPK